MANQTKLVRRWATQTLQGLGIRPNARNVTALVGWQRAEGGHTNNTARYNFLNTTLNLPGSGDTGSQGNISVYKNFNQGVQATVKTLALPAYKGIRQALAHGSPRDVASAIGSSPWGTSASLVTQAIAGTPTVRPIAGSVRGEGPSLRDSSSSSPGSYTIPGVDNSAARRQLQLAYLQNSHDPNALLNLAYGLKGAQDTASRTIYQPSTPGRTTVSGNVSAPHDVRHLKGVTTFDNKQVAAWIAPILRYARKHGWKGQVNSGYRSDAEQKRIYDSGVRPAAKPRAYGGSGSNHEFKAFPGGAIDVSDAESLSRILQRSPYRHLLQYAGAKDPVHFSHPHNGSY